MVENSSYEIRLTSHKKRERDEELMSDVYIVTWNYDTFIFLHNAIKEILEKEEKNANKNNQQND